MVEGYYIPNNWPLIVMYFEDYIFVKVGKEVDENYHYIVLINIILMDLILLLSQNYLMKYEKSRDA